MSSTLETNLFILLFRYQWCLFRDRTRVKLVNRSFSCLVPEAEAVSKLYRLVNYMDSVSQRRFEISIRIRGNVSSGHDKPHSSHINKTTVANCFANYWEVMQEHLYLWNNPMAWCVPCQPKINLPENDTLLGKRYQWHVYEFLSIYAAATTIATTITTTIIIIIANIIWKYLIAIEIICIFVLIMIHFLLTIIAIMGKASHYVFPFICLTMIF